MSMVMTMCMLIAHAGTPRACVMVLTLAAICVLMRLVLAFSSLKAKYDEAKALGESVNAARGEINKLKGQIEAVRRDRAVAEVTESEGGGGGGASAAAAEEERLKVKMEEGKRMYKEGFAKLL